LRPFSDGMIIVPDAPDKDLESFWGGDSVKLTFNVKVAEDVAEGTHNLELAIEGNSFDYNKR